MTTALYSILLLLSFYFGQFGSHSAGASQRLYFVGERPGAQTKSADFCEHLTPVECREETAKMVEPAFRKKAPNIQVRAVGKKKEVIVFTDPELFATQEERLQMRKIIETSRLKQELCLRGFLRLRIQPLGAVSDSTTDESSLNCSVSSQAEGDLQAVSVYSARAFDVSSEALETNYVGYDPEALFAEASAGRTKDEFETTAEYDRRLSEAYGSLANRVYAFPSVPTSLRPF